jgi:hypothetical protein
MILVAGPYRSGTNDDPALIARNVEAMTDTALRLFPQAGAEVRRVPADRRAVQRRRRNGGAGEIVQKANVLQVRRGSASALAGLPFTPLSAPDSDQEFAFR